MRNSKINLEDILTDKTGDEDLLEIPVSALSFNFSLVALAAIALVAGGYLLIIAIFKHSFYEEKALANTNKIIIEKPERGLIFDRFGKPLTKNTPISNLILSPSDLPSDPMIKQNLLEEIKAALQIDDEDWKEIEAKIQSGKERRVLAKRDLTLKEIVALDEPGKKSGALRIENDFTRVYKKDLSLSHLVGYTGLADAEDLEKTNTLLPDDVLGKSGLEAYYDSWLRGVNGRVVRLNDARGRAQDERFIQEAVGGLNLKTSIDSEFQAYFYERLSEQLSRLGRSKAVGIALKPESGEVLALLSLPSFDLQNIRSYLNDPKQALFNRAVSGLYNPGSTVKPLVATAALAEGVIAPDKQIFSKGYLEVPNPWDSEKPTRLLDWRPHGWVDLKAAIARSSNVYFYEIGGGFGNQIGLGIDRLKKYWQIFGLGEKTGIDIMGEKTGTLPDPEYKQKKFGNGWLLGDTYNVSIGQGDLTVAPVGLLNYVSAIANGGRLLKPRIVKTIEDGEGKTVWENKLITIKNIEYLKPYLDEVKTGMEEAASEPYGTAYALSALPFKTAAKTGTAQVKNNEETNALFVGFAPSGNPKIALLILIENSVEGSQNTVPVAKDVLMWYYENRIQKLMPN